MIRRLVLNVNSVSSRLLGLQYGAHVYIFSSVCEWMDGFVGLLDGWMVEWMDG